MVVSCSQCVFLVVPRLRVGVFVGVGVCHRSVLWSVAGWW